MYRYLPESTGVPFRSVESPTETLVKATRPRVPVYDPQIGTSKPERSKLYDGRRQKGGTHPLPPTVGRNMDGKHLAHIGWRVLVSTWAEGGKCDSVLFFLSDQKIGRPDACWVEVDHPPGI